MPFHIDGDDIVVDLDALTVRFNDKTYAPPASAAAGSDGKLRAPMDGRIVSIKVAAGDSVTRGQTLIVLEAMKIQHQLKAALDAKIESVAVQEGQQVSNRTVLVTMAPRWGGRCRCTLRRSPTVTARSTPSTESSSTSPTARPSC